MKIFSKIDKFLVIGISSSIILGLLLFILGVDTISSLIIGLLGTIISLQIDQIARQEQASEKNILNTQILKQIDESSLSRKLLLQVIQNYHIVSTHITNDFFKEYALVETQRFLSFLSDLSKGSLQTKSNDNNAIIRLMEQTKHSLMVVSLSSANNTWWKTPMGKKFWEANLDALQRNVRIKRIFLFKEHSTESKTIMKKNFDAGIEVYWVTFNELPIELQQGFALFDKSIGYKLRQTPEGNVVGYTFIIDEAGGFCPTPQKGSIQRFNQ